MRSDAPGQRTRTRGAFPDLSTPEARESALQEADGAIYATSSKAPHESRKRFLVKALDAWGMELFPPTPDEVRIVGASLKKGVHLGLKLPFRISR